MSQGFSRRVAYSSTIISGPPSPSISGYGDWWDSQALTYTDTSATTPSVSSNDPVKSWVSSAGTALKLTYSVSWPLLQLSQINSFPGIQIRAGLGDRLTVLQSNSQPFTIFMVLKLVGNDVAFNQIFNSPNSSTNIIQRESSANPVPLAIYAGSSLTCNNNNLSQDTWG